MKSPQWPETITLGEYENHPKLAREIARQDANPRRTHRIRASAKWPALVWRRPSGKGPSTLQHHLETWLATAARGERTVPRFVERELRSYLECGILAHGFLRVHCDACGHDRLVAFSCKGRGFCPSCGGRRMADTAAHLVDRVLPHVPVRQWVLSVPFALRYRMGYDGGLASQALKVFVAQIQRSLRRRARRRGLPMSRAKGGSVTFVQRFGGALNLNVHFHTLVLDGVYHEEDDGELRFHTLPPPSPREIEQVLTAVIEGIRRHVERSGLTETADSLHEEDPLHAQLLSAAVQSRAATGEQAGQRVLRFGDPVLPEPDKPTQDAADKQKRLATQAGFSLHASVHVPARQRTRLERLCRYVARPPVCGPRLTKLPDGRLLYELRHRWRDGTTHVAFKPSELIDRLAALVPPPRFHMVRYHGVLASRSKYRSRVVPSGAAQEDATDESCGHAPSTSETSHSPSPERHERNYTWSELMKRVFETDVLRCTVCTHEPMRILSAIHPPKATRKILDHLGLPSRAPPITPSRVAPEF